MPAPQAFHQASFASGGGGHGGDAGGSSGGGGLLGGLSGLFHKIFSTRTIMFAGLGAVAATAIPPLAFLGGPIGGAIAGALLSMVI